MVRKDEESGQFSSVYEVFDTPYEDEPPAGESEEVQNPASGEAESGASGALPPGEKTREEEPPSPPSAAAPSADGPSTEADTKAGVEVPPGEPDAPPAERTALAARLLGSLARSEPRLALGAAEALRLAPLVEEWWAAGASSAQVRAALTQGLPPRLYSPRALVEDRLRRKCPAAPAAPDADAAAAPAAVGVGGADGATAVRPVTTVEIRTPGASGGYREAAQRGGALARALLRGRPAPA